MCKPVEIGKKGDVLRYHPGIKNLTKKNPVDSFLPKNVTVKNIHIDIIAPNFTIIFLRYLKLCFSWMAPRKNEVVEESYYTLIFCCFFIYEMKTN